MQFYKLIAFSFSLVSLACCRNKETAATWHKYISDVGTYSSPGTADLNNDGVLDIILGSGGKEEEYSDTAVIAIDGASGNPIWAVEGYNQFVGSPVFIDVTNDKVPDVFIGGRWAQLLAIDGRSGKKIWSFFPERTKTDGSDGGWYNFTTPQVIPDQDNDGIADILIANGGDARAAPSDTNRPAGKIIIVGSKTGEILSSAVVPDGKETYMSVVCDHTNEEIIVYFGTGGETIGGHFYKTTLRDIKAGNIANAKILATSDSKGFIASPVLVDITNDGQRDIIVNSVDGRMLAINGKNDSLIWQIKFPGTEAYTVPAVGFFNNDSVPDFFANYAIGVFPKLNYSVRFMVDGKTGSLGYADTIPAFQYASAVVADLNGDNFDEAIVNQATVKRKQFDNLFHSSLLAFDFKNNRRFAFADTLPGTNLASTPWIGDLDNDGYFDFVYTSVKYENALFDLQQPKGLFIHRFVSNIQIKKQPLWGGFMGRNGAGVFNPK